MLKLIIRKFKTGIKIWKNLGFFRQLAHDLGPYLLVNGTYFPIPYINNNPINFTLNNPFVSSYLEYFSKCLFADLHNHKCSFRFSVYWHH